MRHIKEGFSIRAFVGYSGWAEGQLESELQQRAWITHKAERRVVETDDLETLWNRMLRELGATIPILFVSGYHEHSKSLEGLENVALLSKPYKDDSLSDAIAKLLTRHG